LKLLDSSGEDYVARLKNDDQAAFKELYNIYSKRLYGFAFRFLKNKEQSEEVVQESMLNLWINRARLNENYPIAPYLFTITRHLVSNSLRHMISSKAVLEKLWESVTYLHNETEEQINLNDLQEFAADALKQLPKQQQLIFRLSREEGLSHHEIATRLQISKNTVKNHMVSALKNLRTQFSDYDVICLLFILYTFY